MSRCKFACLAVVVAAMLAVSTAGTGRAAGKTCPVIPFSAAAQAIGPLVKSSAGFQQYGSKPKTGTWLCDATSQTAYLTIQAGCHLPYIDGLFYEYAHNIGKADGDVWKKMKGLGDQAELIINKKPDPVLGQVGALAIKRGGTSFMVIGSVGNPSRAASLRPMPTAKLVKLARTVLKFKCP